MSILIVDDEQDIRELIGDILRDEGYSTRLAANSDDCMAEINAELPSLMILDIWLKDSRMDGIDILKTVKRDNPDVPVVIISGHGNIEIAVAAIKQAINRGADMGLADACMYEAALFGDISATADAREGTSAFLEKRQPTWSGQ